MVKKAVLTKPQKPIHEIYFSNGVDEETLEQVAKWFVRKQLEGWSFEVKEVFV